MTAKKYIAAAFVAALATGSANAAEKIKFSVGGDIQSVFTTQFVQARPNGDTTNKKIDHANVRQDAYIRFAADTVLDNGLKVGAKAEFEALTNGGAAFDPQEVYLTVGGKFGDVQLGRAKTAAENSHVYIPSANVPGLGVDDANISPFGATSRALGTADVTTDGSRAVLGEYASRVAYYTPRVQGLRFGASFTPNGRTDTLFQSGPTGRANSGLANNEVSLGANYSRKVGQVSVDASAGYTFANGTDTAVTVPSNNSFANLDGAKLKSPKAYQAGLALGYKGFTLGGAYSEVKVGARNGYVNTPKVVNTNPLVIGNTQDQLFANGQSKQRTYGVGVKYKTGPWTYGLSGLEQKNSTRADGTTRDNSRVRLYEAGVSYILGPGVTTGAGVYYNENRNAQDGIAAAVGLGLSF